MLPKNKATILFIALLAFLTVSSYLLPEKSFSAEENRFLARRPVFTVKAFLKGGYGNEVETFLSDQFPFRGIFVTAKTKAERMAFKQDVNGIYFGRDDYYIERFDPEELLTELLSKNLGYIAEASRLFVERLGEDHVRILLAPSASQILTGRLPPFAAPTDQGEVIRMLEEKLTNSALLLPVEQELREHQSEPLYYKTDHHWTTLGAYYGYRLYASSIGLIPWEEGHFIKETASGNFFGTIHSKIRISMKPDHIVRYRPKGEGQYRVFYDGLPEEHDSLYNEKALEGKDQYALFLDGNHGWTKIINDTVEAEGKSRRLLIVKDSYAHCFAPFAANHFEETHMVDLRYFNGKLSEFMELQHITDVLVLYQIPGLAMDKNLFKIVK